MKKLLLIFTFLFLVCSVFPQQFTEDNLKINNTQFIFVKTDSTYGDYAEIMSSNDNGIKKVIDRCADYYISKYEITNAEFAEFLNYNGSDKVKSGKYAGKLMVKLKTKYGLYRKNGKWVNEQGNKDFPVTGVSWYGANEYCIWLSRKTEKKISLPTKRQWTYAASGGIKYGKINMQSKSEFKKHVAYIKNTHNKPLKKGSKLPNELGIFDMYGNVKEWCFSLVWSQEDWVSEDIGMGGSIDVLQNVTHEKAVLRGGSWATSKRTCLSEKSRESKMSFKAKDSGFRICYIPE